MNPSLIVLDADGVLINYHEGYAMAWERAFGQRPQVRDPLGYHPRHYWDVPALDEAGRRHLADKGFVDEIWRSMPALPGAVEACELLQAAGHCLRCVTALYPKHEGARAANLAQLGFRMDAVHAVGPAEAGNPKLAKLSELRPVAFVDDYIAYLQGVPRPTWRALIDARPNHSPNRDAKFEQPDSRHNSLLEFARWWTTREA